MNDFSSRDIKEPRFRYGITNFSIDGDSSHDEYGFIPICPVCENDICLNENLCHNCGHKINWRS